MADEPTTPFRSPIPRRRSPTAGRSRAACCRGGFRHGSWPASRCVIAAHHPGGRPADAACATVDRLAALSAAAEPRPRSRLPGPPPDPGSPGSSGRPGRRSDVRSDSAAVDDRPQAPRQARIRSPETGAGVEYESLFASNVVSSRRPAKRNARISGTPGDARRRIRAAGVDRSVDRRNRRRRRPSDGPSATGTPGRAAGTSAALRSDTGRRPARTDPAQRHTAEHTAPISAAGPLHRVLEGTSSTPS